MTESQARAFVFDDRTDDLIGMTAADLHTGSFVDCVKAVWAQPEDVRRYCYVTEGEWTYDPAQLEMMRAEDAGEI